MLQVTLSLHKQSDLKKEITANILSKVNKNDGCFNKDPPTFLVTNNVSVF